MKIGQEGSWGSLFQKPHHKKYTKLVARPLGLEQGAEEARQGLWRVAEKVTSFRKISFWSFPGPNFKDNLPFDGMRPTYAAFVKETPMTLPVLFSKS
ncbi:MAG: hypothetical protein JSV50_06845 [Desulfobacteraceae bacterium]|nr:MAG: hypothetical protein JSV50_06845 [Desulfobacteraceae bacterium]